MRRSFAPLRHRPFRLLAIGQLTSNIGDLFSAVALPWYVLSHHGGALLLGIVLACYGSARIAALMVGGSLSDRLRPWTVMFAADAGRAVISVVLALIVASEPPRLVLLAPVGVLLGVGGGLFMPGSLSIIPALLPDEDLQAGNALSAGWTQLAILLGPAIGGVVVAAVGPAPALAVDATTYVVSALTLLGVRAAIARSAGEGARGAGAPDAEPVGADDTTTMHNPASSTAAAAAAAAAGSGSGSGSGAAERPSLWQVIRAERVLRLIFGITLVANLGSGGESEVALPALAHGPFHSGAGGFGALIAALGAGALAGTLLAAQAPRFTRPAVVASWAYLAECLFSAVVPYVGGTIPAAVMLALFGLLNGFANVLLITAFQRWARPEMLGRMMGVLMLGSFGTFPVSVLVGGVIVHTLGPGVFFPLNAAAVLLAVLVALGFRDWREFGATDAPPEPAADWVAAPRVRDEDGEAGRGDLIPSPDENVPAGR